MSMPVNTVTQSYAKRICIFFVGCRKNMLHWIKFLLSEIVLADMGYHFMRINTKITDNEEIKRRISMFRKQKSKLYQEVNLVSIQNKLWIFVTNGKLFHSIWRKMIAQFAHTKIHCQCSFICISFVKNWHELMCTFSVKLYKNEWADTIKR